LTAPTRVEVTAELEMERRTAVEVLHVLAALVAEGRGQKPGREDWGSSLDRRAETDYVDNLASK